MRAMSQRSSRPLLERLLTKGEFDLRRLQLALDDLEIETWHQDGNTLEVLVYKDRDEVQIRDVLAWSPDETLPLSELQKALQNAR